MSNQGEKSGWGAGTWIACGCGGCILVILLFIGLAVGGVVTVGGLTFLGIRKSDVFEEAMQRARTNPDVVEALGEPIEAGLLISGSFQITPTSGAADFSIPVSGPKGKGKLYVVATKSAGQWEFNTLELEVEQSDLRIDLLGGEIEILLHPPIPPPSASPPSSRI